MGNLHIQRQNAPLAPVLHVHLGSFDNNQHLRLLNIPWLVISGIRNDKSPIIRTLKLNQHLNLIHFYRKHRTYIVLKYKE